ncbi:MAG: IS1595 family transposase [Albidovulum sp.]|nr:IS1595 family transposase [Albidovulum sp.]
MAQQTPGKSHRKGVGIKQLMKTFPNEEAARKWLESEIWPDGPYCPHCGSFNVQSGIKHSSMTHRCRDCPNRPQFSIKSGTVMKGTKLECRDWAIAVYILTTNLEGISSMKLHRELEITRKSAWHLMHRLRAAFAAGETPQFSGPVGADETCIGGLEKNKHRDKKLNACRGGIGKAIVAGVKDREVGQVAPDTAAKTLQGFGENHSEATAQVYADDGRGYAGIDRAHESVNHSAGESVRDMAHADGIESFRANLERGHKVVFHKFGKKHLQRYAEEFAGRHNARNRETLNMMQGVVSGMVGKQLRYADLTADNGLASEARS